MKYIDSLLINNLKKRKGDAIINFEVLEEEMRAWLGDNLESRVFANRFCGIDRLMKRFEKGERKKALDKYRYAGVLLGVAKKGVAKKIVPNPGTARALDSALQSVASVVAVSPLQPTSASATNYAVASVPFRDSAALDDGPSSAVNGGSREHAHSPQQSRGLNEEREASREDGGGIGALSQMRTVEMTPTPHLSRLARAQSLMALVIKPSDPTRRKRGYGISLFGADLSKMGDANPRAGKLLSLGGAGFELIRSIAAVDGGLSAQQQRQSPSSLEGERENGEFWT